MVLSLGPRRLSMHAAGSAAARLARLLGDSHAGTSRHETRSECALDFEDDGAHIMLRPDSIDADQALGHLNSSKDGSGLVLKPSIGLRPSAPHLERIQGVEKNLEAIVAIFIVGRELALRAQFHRHLLLRSWP